MLLRNKFRRKIAM